MYIRIEEKQTVYMPGITSLWVSFNYDETIVSYIKELEFAVYYKDLRAWEIPLTYLSAIITRFINEAEIDLILTPEHKVQANYQLLDVNLKSNPFPHQIDAVEFGLNNKGWILGDEPGLGKTLSVIDLALQLKAQGKISHCLIVCGINSIKLNWAEEIEKHSGATYKVLGRRKRKKKDAWYMGSMQDKIDDIMTPTDDFFFITNIETFRDETFLEALYQTPMLINLWAIDEAHKCKGINSKQGAGILTCKYPVYKIAMTGTPLHNKPTDAYVSLAWTENERSKPGTFLKYYTVKNSDGEVVGYRNLNMLKYSVQHCMLRRLKKDIFNLPEKIISHEYVEMSKDQEELYKTVVNNVKKNPIVDKVKLSLSPMANWIRLRQATSNPKILSTKSISCAKLDRMEELVEEITDNGGKVVVVSNWTMVTDEIKERLKKYNYVEYTGKLSEEDRAINKKAFQNDPSVKVFIGTISTMGAALTLTAAQTMIIVDNVWNASDLKQLTDRLHRIGTTGVVNIIILVTRNTVDELVEDIIDLKGMVSDYVVDGEVPEGNLNKILLEYLKNT